MVSGRACLFVVTGLWLANWADPALAQEEPGCEVATANFTSLQGSAELKRARSEDWRTATLGDVLCPGDSVRTGDRSRAGVLLVELETTSRLDQNTELTLGPEDENGRSLLDIARGVIHFLSQVPRRLNVQTPFVNAAVEGTEFLVSVEADRASIIVFQGTMALSNERGTLQLASGQSAVAMAGEAPQIRLVARPRDAVQWAIYYPPILIGLAEGLPPGLRDAILARRRGAVAEAFRHLEEVAEAEREAKYFVYRAGLLLAVGRLDEARSDIDRALAQTPENAEANALLSVIAVALAVTRDDVGEALQAGQRAVELSPQSSVAKIALSYAQQANFELGSARDTLLQAVEAQPNDGLAWARLAELWLTLGYTRRALKAAETAASRAPGLSRTNTVLGFSALARVDTAGAKAAFEAAIALDSADPLPRLGLGLAKIRDGELREGRSDLEIAASLDPNNALIRSYLGKAYFEERRNPLAAEQLALARELDPNDPTPWLYDAIRKQSENRPVEALRDLQKSIDLNDNRAVYRSRLLLDGDLAARGASLARIYEDLGFEQLALVEATKSLEADPANHSAHRALSDSYAAQPRHEIARASELLRAQLLQPININPVQPSLSEVDLNIITSAGPANVGFNEFTPLFERDRLQLVGTGVAGNNGALGDELVLSGIEGRTSFSVGQFHFESDGFRLNNDVEHDIYEAFGQVALSEQLSLQAEVRRRDSDQGDLRLNFDPDDFSTIDRRKVRQDNFRFGAHYEPTPQSDILVSFIYGDRHGNQKLLRSNLRITEQTNDHGYHAEGQYILREDRFNVTAGISTYDIDVDERINTDFTLIPPFFVSCPPFIPATTCDSELRFKREHKTGYIYTNIEVPEDVTWTLGFSYDSYEQLALDLDEFNHKLGVQWNITDNIRLRAAEFETVKRALTADQSIEPTQVAGFNQFFDDVNGTTSERYGLGLDIQFTDDLYGGVEASRRDLVVPAFSGDTVSLDGYGEDFYRAYLYWTPHRNWAVSAEPQFERFERDLEAADNLPIEVETLSLPLAVRYFNSAGFFASLGGTYVRQRIDHAQLSTFAIDKDDFVIVDAIVGYRFPQRRAIFSIEARNLLDEEFLFQDQNIQSSEPVNPRYIPDRQIMVRTTFNF